MPIQIILNIKMRIWLLLILILGMVYFTMQRKIYPQLSYNAPLSRLQHPLDTRLRYRIGAIDPGFGLSQQQLMQLSQQAGDIWNMGTGRDYFVYDPKAKLTINLIYDERQAESVARQQKVQRIETTRSLTDAEQQKVQQLDAQLAQAKSALDLSQSNYQHQLAQYNQTVQDFNQTQQYLTDAVRQQLSLQKQQLQQQQFALQQQIYAFNLKVSQLNQQVHYLNAIHQQLNQSIDSFNQHFQPHQFDKGLFNGREINIYEFESEDDLRLTLAHELGHALGLQHTQDPKALMYPVMQRQDLKNFKLTAADLELLNSRH